MIMKKLLCGMTVCQQFVQFMAHIASIFCVVEEAITTFNVVMSRRISQLEFVSFCKHLSTNLHTGLAA